MNRLTGNLAMAALCAVIGLALACGGGGSSNKSMMTGTIDLTVPGAQKAVFQAPEAGDVTVTFRNIGTGAESTTTNRDGSFSIVLLHGDYEIVAQNADGRTVRKIFPGFSSGNRDARTVDASSTAVAVTVFLCFVESDSAVNALADVEELANVVSSIESILDTAEDVLLGRSAGNEEASLFALGTLEAVVQAMANNTDLSDETADEFIDLVEVEDAFDEALADVLEDNPGESVTLGERTFDAVEDVPEDLSSIVDAGEIFEDLRQEAVGDGEGEEGEIVQLATITVVSADWSSGALSTVTTTGTRTATNRLLACDTSDQDIASYGSHLYIIRRYMADNILKVNGASIDAEGIVYQYSTLGATEQGTGNPQWIAFAGDTKAYVSRYEYNTMWIVNPSAEDESDFKIGEIDLSQFADGDGIVEMSKMVIVGSKLFVCLQRLDRTDAWDWIPSNTAYVVVIDTETDLVVDVDPDTEGDQAVELLTRNPLDIRYLPETGLVYIQSVGRYPGFGTDAEYTGGIETIDPATYHAQLIVDDDDGTGSAAYGGNVSEMVLASATRGYLVSYAGWGDNSVRSFDPTTGAVGEVIAGLAGINVAGLAVDRQGYLWVLDATYTAPGVRVFDTATDTQVGGLIDLGGLCPTSIAFVDVAE